MASFIPVTLSGYNLGQRHRYLNFQVDKAATSQVSFQDIEVLPEQTPVDRLFKIDLAIKLKNIDFILKNIKDDDMLYVSRALKCKWLLDQRDIINPNYLETVLFPDMVMPAISKMKHWLYINLRDSLVCQEFYQYYKDTNFDFAVKFLSHCNIEFLINEFPKILSKITPHYLKVLGEKYPKLVKIYYDSLATDKELVKRYLKDEQNFYNNIKCILKSDPELFLNITEKYHSLSGDTRLSPTATDFILRFHKSRFMAKPELYVVYLLHIPTVAQQLSAEECQDVVIQLARAEFLSWWFQYKNVEPLVKRISRDKRAAFKKRVFVEKDIGERVATCPYVMPASPVATDTDVDESHVFHDQEYYPITMIFRHKLGKMLMKRSMCRKALDCYTVIDSCPLKSELQKLYDEFRFVGFEGTIHELKGRLGAVSSADRRRDILLVLVSKSGGRADSVRELLQLALRLRNEPVHERAAVVRSLAKRATMWRLPQDVWDSLLEYSNGLGLDGSKPEAECREGLHAVVIRQLLATGNCEPAVRTAFLEDFSTLADYKLTASERTTIAASLQSMLVTAAGDEQPEVAANHLSQLLDVLEKYRIRIESSPAVSAVATLATRDSEAARPLLERLYAARVGRRELLRQYLEFRHDDAAFLNILRHDPDALKPESFLKLLIDDKTCGDQFLSKLSLYFNEKGGKAEQIRQVIKDKIVHEPIAKLARPLATLAGDDMSTLLCDQDVDGDRYKLVAALRANMHRARPAPDALALGWRKTGMKAVAWRAMRCRPSQKTQLIRKLLDERAKRTLRLALALAQRTDCAFDVFSTAVSIKPLAALRAALFYYKNLGEAADHRIWNLVKPFILTVDLTSRDGLRHLLTKVKWVPKTIKPDYCALVYLALDKVSDNNADHLLRDLMECLHEVSEDLLEMVLIRTMENIDKENPVSYPAIVMRYLMLSRNDSMLSTRFEKIGNPFLKKIDSFRDNDEVHRNFFKENFEQVLVSLQYNCAFFDAKYQCCLSAIEIVLIWMREFLPKEIHFKKYVKIHATMLYCKAVRQSMKQKPEIFENPLKKMSEGVEIVGFTFGRYIAKELGELMSKYFTSIVELYHNAFTEYLEEYFVYGDSKFKFMAAVTKGILSESVGIEARLAIYVLRDSRYYLKTDEVDELKALIRKNENKNMQFFIHAELSF